VGESVARFSALKRLIGKLNFTSLWGDCQYVFVFCSVNIPRKSGKYISLSLRSKSYSFNFCLARRRPNATARCIYLTCSLINLLSFSFYIFILEWVRKIKRTRRCLKPPS